MTRSNDVVSIGLNFSFNVHNQQAFELRYHSDNGQLTVPYYMVMEVNNVGFE